MTAMVLNDKYAWMHDASFMDSLVKAQIDAEKFRENLLHSIESAKRHQQQVIQQAADNIQNMLKTEQNLIAEAQQIQLVKQREKQELEDLQAQLSGLKIKEDNLPDIVDSYQRQFNLAKEELEDRRKAIKEQEKEINVNMQRAALGIEYYRSRFGIQFEKIDDTGIRIILTNIDPNNHSRKFNFALRVDESEHYQLVECKPRVGEIQPLIEELNSTNNISRFTVQMRKKFQEYCVSG